MPDWLRQVQTFGIFAAGYLARPLGGIVMAHFGDLLGRKRMFMLSIFLMSLPTLAIGLLPTYASIGIWAPLLLLALRVLQGAAIGGEVPGAWVFVSEHVPPRHIGFACGTLTSGLTGGILLGSLVAMSINKIYSPAEVLAEGWRVPFIIGGVFRLDIGVVAPMAARNSGIQRVAGQARIGERIAFTQSSARPSSGSDSNHVADLAVVGRYRGDDFDDTHADTKALLYSPRIGFAGKQHCHAKFEFRLRIVFGALADRFGPGQVLAFGCAMLGITSATVLSTNVRCSRKHQRFVRFVRIFRRRNRHRPQHGS
jgi:MFS family permease